MADKEDADLSAAVSKAGVQEPWSAEENPTAALGIDPEDETARIEVLQSNEELPYHSAKTFEELNLSPDLLQGVYAMKFNKPSKIQAASLPIILGGMAGEPQSLVGQGHNGSGKTACFALAMLSAIDVAIDHPQAICVAPTRELARQIAEVVTAIGKFVKPRVYLAVPPASDERGSGPRLGADAIREQIVIGTPGKLLTMVQKKTINTSQVKIFVLDEADVMVNEGGHGAKTVSIKRALPADVRCVLFSATYAEHVRAVAEKIAPKAVWIEVKREELSLRSVKQYFIRCESAEGRFDTLSEIFASLSIGGATVIFVKKVADVKTLASRLRAEKYTVSVLHGQNMQNEERDKIIDEFRAGQTKVLVTTDVLSRGVDIMHVRRVINYDLPVNHQTQQADPETYMHRVGRTGRFGRTGVAVNFVYDDASRAVLAEIEKYYNHAAEEVKDAEELDEKIKTLG